jgi:hypothetical protein
VRPILQLDINLAENDPGDRPITGRPSGGGQAQRLKQEILLGIDGERRFAALGFSITAYHLNEEHAALLALSLRRLHRLQSGEPEFLVRTRDLPADALLAARREAKAAPLAGRPRTPLPLRLPLPLPLPLPE